MACREGCRNWWHTGLVAPRLFFRWSFCLLLTRAIPVLSGAHSRRSMPGQFAASGPTYSLDSHYEFARPSHALLDGIYWRGGFPTCWCAGRTPGGYSRPRRCGLSCRVSTAIPQAHEDTAYRVQLTHGGAPASHLSVVAIGPGARPRREMGYLVNPRKVALVCRSGHPDDRRRSGLARDQQCGPGLAVGASAALARCIPVWPIPWLRKQAGNDFG